RARSRGRHDDVGLEPDQFFCGFVELCFPLEPAVIENNILSFGVAELMEAVAKRVNKRIGRAAHPQDADSRNFFRLLRMGKMDRGQEQEREESRSDSTVHTWFPRNSQCCFRMVCRLQVSRAIPPGWAPITVFLSKAAARPAAFE